MAKDIRYARSFGTKLRFLLRFLGITGAFAAAVGLMVYRAEGLPFELNAIIPTLEEAGHNHLGQTAMVASCLLVIGAGLAVLSILVEVLAGFGKAAGRHSLVGANATLQMALAVFVLVAVNAYSFNFSKRWDLTADKEFTLPPEVKDELGKLRGETKIVTLQLKSTFGKFSKEPDDYDNAAETVVVEKIRDLVDQFRRLGPQFRVASLDRKNRDFNLALDEVAGDNPKLREAILGAPESSIFFAAEGRVQRLSFNEFYQLDKTASKSANGGKGNLVLRPQGVMPFLSRITAIQERRPRVGLAVIHQVLSSQQGEGFDKMYSSSGLRKSLESHGFDVTDIVLKKWNDQGPPTPAAYNYEETELERLESEVETAEADLREVAETRGDLDELVAIFEKSSLAEVKAEFEKKLGGRIKGELTEDFRKRQKAAFQEQIDELAKRLADMKAERDTKRRELNALLAREKGLEDRRVTDVKAKFARMVADCDLLILPRMTILNPASESPGITARVYNLSKEQIDVIKDSMKAGKPVLALLGPTNGGPNQPPPEPDDLEKLLADRGVELGRQTVLFDADRKAFASWKAGEQFGNKPLEIPTVTFAPGKAKRPNPLAQAMLATGQSVDQALDIRLRAPRPVYLLPGFESAQDFAGEFVSTSGDTWNDDQPIVGAKQQNGRTTQYIPHFESAKLNDPRKGTHDEPRHGPFPIGVAVESKVPIEWFDPEYTGLKTLSGRLNGADQGLLAACLTAAAQTVKRPTERLVVVGQGGLFVDTDLGPAKEQFLLHTCNWLLGREDRLPKGDEKVWEYPRVELGEKRKFLWQYGALFGLPALFVYFGIVVLMIRNLR